MLLRTRWTRQIGSTLPRRTPWRSTPVRRYASKNSEEPLLWFKELRAEMLQRPLIYLPEHINATREDQLCQTLRGILPPHYCHAPKSNELIPVGHHLIWFNPATPTNELLPDGTDTLHSPGRPWVRRLWAGGAIRVRPEEYYHRDRGFANGTPMLGVEEISEVKLHGEGDDAKIFVTIERHFIRQATVEERYFAKHGLLGRTHTARSKIFKYFADQLLADRVHKRERWGEAALQEQRTLVFLKKHNEPQISQTLPTKYLSPPNSECDFSQLVHPNRTLLFRFSALTFNAHRIHLDPDYARNVEGHRNLLVHGPLSLTLLLQVFNTYLAEHTDGVQAVVSIEYRNIAPLYCDERMRICGSRKKTVLNGAVYDVWIEGPTGGVAVRGTIHTYARRANLEAIQNESPSKTEEGAPIKRTLETEKSPQENPSSENSPTPRGLSFVRLQDPRLRGRMASALNGLDRLEKKNVKAQRKLLFKEAENTIGEEEKALKYQKLLETLEAEEKATENEKVTIAARRERERFKGLAKKQLKATQRALSKLSKLNTSPHARDPAELSTTSEVGQQPPSQQPQVTPSFTPNSPAVVVYSGKPRTRLRAYNFVAHEPPPPPTVRIVESHATVKSTDPLYTKRKIRPLVHRYTLPEAAAVEPKPKPTPRMSKVSAGTRPSPIHLRTIDSPSPLPLVKPPNPLPPNKKPRRPAHVHHRTKEEVSKEPLPLLLRKYHSKQPSKDTVQDDSQFSRRGVRKFQQHRVRFVSLARKRRERGFF